MTEDNIEIGICNSTGFRRLEPSEIKDYLASVSQEEPIKAHLAQESSKQLVGIHGLHK